MSVLVRRAVAADLDELIELAAEYCEADGHDFDETTVRAGFGPLLDDDRHGVVLVAVLDGGVESGGAEGGGVEGRVDGYGVVTWGWSIEIGGLDVVLDELYVRSKRRGVGTELIRQLEAECRTRGVKRIFLETELPNDAARRLYEREGYVADSSIWMSKELA